MRYDRLLVVAVSVAITPTTARAELLRYGVLNDEQTSIVYYPETGEVAVDAPAGRLLTSYIIDSMDAIFTGVDAHCGWDPDDWCNNLLGAGWFGSLSLGNVAQAGLSHNFILNDLWVVGSLSAGGGLGAVDLVYMHDLFPGDANRDFSFDQLDIVQVMQAGKYLTGEPASWGEGDWNGGPGGYPGEPPPGDGLFDQKDILAALQTGAYLSGAYAAIQPGGVKGDDQTSIIYDARTGEIAVDAIAAPIDSDQFGETMRGQVFTGSYWNGISGFCPLGHTGCIHDTWPGQYESLAFGGPSHIDHACPDCVYGHMYALSERLTVPAPPALHPGDADMDLEVDHLDLILVLRAAKYLTGEPATWGEGDWNGAPGGYPGNPPVGDGIFDQLDVFVALSTDPWWYPYADPFPCGGGQLCAGIAPPAITRAGVLGDDQTSVVYDPRSGEITVDAPAGGQLTSINIDSAAGVFEAWDQYQNLDGSFDVATSETFFKATFGNSFGSITLGKVAQIGLSSAFLLNDLTVAGSLDGGGGLGPVDLVYMRELNPGDANRDFAFDQLDVVQVLQAGKYLTGEPATWGQGDWDGAPGGYPGEPPVGDGFFDQEDILAALRTGFSYMNRTSLQPGDADQDGVCTQLDLVKVVLAGKFLTGEAATWGEGDWDGAPGGFAGNPPSGDGRFDQLDIIAAYHCLISPFPGPYGALRGHGTRGDQRTSIIYDARTGEIALEPPDGTTFTSVNVAEPSSLALLVIAIGTAAFSRGGCPLRKTALSRRRVVIHKENSHVTPTS